MYVCIYERPVFLLIKEGGQLPEQRQVIFFERINPPIPFF
jgi:hypothetical protein